VKRLSCERLLPAVLCLGLVAVPTLASADPVSLIANQVIIDNAPFFSVGTEDGLGVANYALNHPHFIDSPYAIFDLGSASSVRSATLTWNFGSLYGGSPPADITLYVGSDADGKITRDDRFTGTSIETFTYSGGERRSHDVTAQLNASLLLGRYFAARLEATIPPGALGTYYGGQFLTPSLSVNDLATVPEPATLTLVAAGLSLGLVRRRRRATACLTSPLQ